MQVSDTRVSSDPVAPGPSRLYLLYHEVRESKSDYSYVVTAQQFAEQLALLRPGASSTSGLRPEITFDDGHISNFEYALPLLAAQGTRATFFITAGWTGTRANYMDWSQLRAVHDAGHSIGAHGWSHALLTHCNDAELEKELLSARLLLQDKLGCAIETMSFPGGRYNKRVLDACRKAGYTQLYTSEPQAYSSGLLVGRLNVRAGMTNSFLLDLLPVDGARLKSLGRQYRLKASIQRLLGDRLYASLWALVNRKEEESDAVSAG